MRACFAAAKSLDVETTPVWLMLIGPSGTGKTAYYLRSCESYARYELTDEISMAGLQSGRANNWGDGLLKRLGARGLWIMPDFTVFLNMREDRRNEVMGIQRRLFDGKYDRVAAGERLHWQGRIHVVAACTNALERFHRVNADLGERFIQIRIERQSAANELLQKTELQRRNWVRFQDEIKDAATNHMQGASSAVPSVPFAIERRILDWAEFVSLGRITTQYNYKDEIIGVGQQEGSGRIHQQFVGMAVADAWLLGQREVGKVQLELIERVAIDCLPWARRAILSWFRTEQEIPISEVREMSGISHPYTFSRAIAELAAIGSIVAIKDSIGGDRVRLSQKCLKMLMAD